MTQPNRAVDLETAAMGALHRMACATPTDLWNDSCHPEEIRAALETGAVGATSNPVLILEALRREPAHWRQQIRTWAEESPQAHEDDLTGRFVEEVAGAGAAALRPVFDREAGRHGFLSLQTNPRFYRNANAVTTHAERLARVAPNIQVKIAVSRSGLDAIEEVTARGIPITATVCFTVPQALAVAEAVERGLKRRSAAGDATDLPAPVCAIMCGRLDDWLRIQAERDGIVVDPGVIDWAGVAVFKEAYRLYRERGYRTRLLSAACRSHLHATEFVGGDVVVSLPPTWWRRINASDLSCEPRIDRPVPPAVLDTLLARFDDFRRAYEPDGLDPEEFDTFPPTLRTLRQFIAALDEVEVFVRDVITPEP